jgi:DNA polymerase III epsilon subunit family exonuclease
MVLELSPSHTASASQLRAITAPLGPVLVIAGPGAGKTFCLIERIRHLIEHEGIPGDRICAFTFTNKAADEIAHRLSALGERASGIKKGTIHAFCAELLREFGESIGVPRGFGIADEEYQHAVLSRLGYPARWRKSFLTRVTEHRLRGKGVLHEKDEGLLRRYERFLEKRNVLDFDMLVMRAATLTERDPIIDELRGRWDYILVDEFQDLNPTQYGILRHLAADHRNIFGVGDDEQSIYSWAGADPQVFGRFTQDFAGTVEVTLGENRRCPRRVLELARKLVAANPSLFDKAITSLKDSAFDVTVHEFENDESEVAWLLDDIRRDRAENKHPWGEIAVLYRRHNIGHGIEGEFLKAAVPCRLATGRALSEDPVVEYVIGALRVIASPTDSVREGEFLRIVLPRTLFEQIRAHAEESGEDLIRTMQREMLKMPKGHEDARKIRRAFYALRNLPALASRHRRLQGLVEELLSQRVGKYRSALEEQHDELSDPAAHPDVVALAERIERAAEANRPLGFENMGGVEIALRGMLAGAGFRRLLLERPHPLGPDVIRKDDVPALGIALGMFKALQLITSRTFSNEFRDYTTIDLETTSKDIKTARIVEVAAVRVRDGHPVAEFHTLVQPGIPIPADASKLHQITDAMVAGAPAFEEIWPRLRDFCGSDVLVAHNGFDYDFPILRRMIRQLGEQPDLCTYDTLPLARDLHPGSRRLGDLAHVFGIDPGREHGALDDTRTLAAVFLKLGELKVVRARKTVLPQILDHLAIGLALSDVRGEEVDRFRSISRVFALGKYSECLDYYAARRQEMGDPSLPTREELIDRLGGEELLLKVRAQKDAAQRYPIAMARMQRLLDSVPDVAMGEQIANFLERVVLSKMDGIDTAQERVNLLTLHSTKGLEFSRVYIVGVADTDLLTGAQDKWSQDDVDEARRLLYVGMTRTKERLVLTYARQRGERMTGDLRFLAEMGLV